jgi:hypothetical protein
MQLEFKVMSARVPYVQCERGKSPTALKTGVNKATGTGSNHGRGRFIQAVSSAMAVTWNGRRRTKLAVRARVVKAALF